MNWELMGGVTIGIIVFLFVVVRIFT